MNRIERDGVRELAEQLRKEDDAKKLVELADRASGCNIPGADAVTDAVGHDCGEMMRGIAEARRRLALRAATATECRRMPADEVPDAIQDHLEALSAILRAHPEVMGHSAHGMGPARGDALRRGVNAALKALGYGPRSHLWVTKK
ncbi:MAG: hypothetical protein MJ058_04305 [Akkermansia sp.]|nr:hypothetical protein [Akkermansia sp.]